MDRKNILNIIKTYPIFLLSLIFSYIAVGKISLYLTTMDEGMSIIWFPNGILLAVFLLRPMREWIWIALAVVPAEILADISSFTPLNAFQFALINLSETMLSAFFMLRLCSAQRSFNNIRFVLLFIVISLAIIPSISAFVGAYIYHTQIETQSNFIAFWRIRFFSDSLGILFLTPLILSWFEYPKKFLFTQHIFESVLTDTLTILLAFSLFSIGFTPSILPTTPMIFVLVTLWIVYRNGLRSGMTMGMIISMIAIYYTIHHQGPFSIFTPVQNTLYIQEFIAAVMTSTLFFGVFLRQVNETNSLLLQSNNALESLAQNLESEVQKKTAELQKANDLLMQLSITDPLTHIYNRRYLEENAIREIAHSTRYGSPLSLILFDIDFFKVINDTYGHQSGDNVLICITQSVKTRIRKDDVFARIGGEEFVILLPNCSIEQAVVLAEEVKESIASLVIPSKNGSVSCTVSIGVSEFSIQFNSFAEFLNDADQKLYRAKESGRNTIIWD
jgi:diguanylate cyclase (GGDEF)-like protein